MRDRDRERVREKESGKERERDMLATPLSRIAVKLKLDLINQSNIDKL